MDTKNFKLQKHETKTLILHEWSSDQISEPWSDNFKNVYKFSILLKMIKLTCVPTHA
jgi:hypothetical protein